MKNLKTLIALLFFLAARSVYSQQATPLRFGITVFKGKNAIENAFLIGSQKNLVLIDALSSGLAAEEISREINGKKLTTIFITHGHPDHFLGLSTILKSNPEAQIYVASEGVKNDIITYVNLATSKGLMDNEPSMKPKSLQNPGGFDYKKIQIISGKRLHVGSENYLLIEMINEPTECRHNTILYSSQLNLLFASDILYNKVFN